MSDSDIIMDDNPLNKDSSKKRKSNKEYIETQLKAYISRLKSDNIPIDFGSEPKSTDHKQWSTYFKKVKQNLEEMKHNAEWAYVGALIIQTHKMMQISKNKTFKDDDKHKKDLMTILTNSILDNISATQAGRCKQVYNHITDLISKLEKQEILLEIWYPLLNKA
ncbi:13495_t:CDS:1, partial [Racocetra persica]